jgi:hypothetical protein
LDATLDPGGVQRLAAPVGEQAHAVGGIHDGVGVGEHAVPWQPGIRVLPDQVRRLNVQGDADDDPERPEADGHPVEVGVLAPGAPKLAVGRHVLQAGHGGGQDPVPAARAVGSRGGRAGDGDVRQRAQVGKRQAPVLQPGGEGTVGRPGADRHRARRLVDDRIGRDARHRDERGPVVREVVE